MSGESRDLPHAAGAFDLFLGGLPQQTVASVDHRETPQQFDKMATADLYRDLLILYCIDHTVLYILCIIQLYYSCTAVV